ncbi:dihydroneopterin aldolase [Chelativorans sp. M5D2P16]|uniref:amino acid kinase family protein n=1 Tax=Chelativorans sp. M5D2P16 TaxID=3095678 RepID=UPI002ACA5865|nr:dihydroneopterin aldolase [Chelativorans sp. M5D2P16]MDZ5696184.1 dihydroneopterin aldolase [Chelativorans sp. M5D2P16]
MKQAVVKLGGSTAFGTHLHEWIDALAAARLAVTIVPGGGPFADQVRKAQKPIGFSDAAAHAMAILAMDQFGHALADLSARFVPARTCLEMAETSAAGHIPVWLPSAMTLGNRAIPESWDITSDSLAAWLAGQLGGEALLLVKETANFSAEDDPDSLVRRGVVDACFSAMLPAGIDFHLAGPEDAATARALFAAGKLPGVRIGAPVLARNAG